MSKISTIEGRKILDSRGKPTVEVKVTTENGVAAIDSVPSGTSTGKYEAALVDVDVACSNINKIIAPVIIGMEAAEQTTIDQKMIALDGTENKNRLGANAILGVSMAAARAAAQDLKIPLYRHINQLFRKVSGLEINPKIPTPMMVMLCGGKHTHTEQAGTLCIQEFSVLGDLSDGIQIWHALEGFFKQRGISFQMGLEGAFAPQIENDEKALQILSEVIQSESQNLKSNLRIGLDIAGNNCRMTNMQLSEYFQKYNIYSFEDPFGEEAWAQFGQLKLELEETKKPFLLIGDDLFATHKSLLEKGINQIVANGIIIKPNQVGSLSETLEVMKLAYQANFSCVVSHRSGETTDTFISDLACGTAAGFLKAGAPIPSERLLKYRRLEEIEKEL